MAISFFAIVLIYGAIAPLFKSIAISLKLKSSFRVFNITSTFAPSSEESEFCANSKTTLLSMAGVLSAFNIICPTPPLRASSEIFFIFFELSIES